MAPSLAGKCHCFHRICVDTFLCCKLNSPTILLCLAIKRIPTNKFTIIENALVLKAYYHFCSIYDLL